MRRQAEETDWALSGASRRGKKALTKTPTFVQGLDEILHGGLPARRTTLLIGAPGSGKTVLGIEYLCRGALNGEPGIHFGFEEPPAALRENAATLGWDLPGLERAKKLFLIQGRIDPDLVVSGRFSLKPLLSVLAGKAQEMGAKRLVLDALDVLLTLFEDPRPVRVELQQLNQWLTACGMTVLITLKPREESRVNLFHEFFQSMADCVIAMDTQVANQVSTRRLRVVKYRGSGFGSNEYPYVITDEGVRLIPLTRFDLSHQPFQGKISSGVPRLDAMLGGGYHRASCVLLAGEPGTGKTLLASTFARHACGLGEKVLYLSFEESPEALVRNVASVGIRLEPFMKKGLLRLVGRMPEAAGAEELLVRLVAQVEETQSRHVIVDAISACERMGGKQVAFEFLTRFLNHLKGRGVTVLLTNQTSGTRSHLEISGNGISSMVDTLVSLSYVHGDGETNRTIQILKSRGAAHANQVREFVIRNDGVRILDAYMGPGGVLTGTARMIQESRDAQEGRRREAEIRAKAARISQLKASLDAETARLKSEIRAAELELGELERERERREIQRSELARLRGGESEASGSRPPKGATTRKEKRREAKKVRR